MAGTRKVHLISIHCSNYNYRETNYVHSYVYILYNNANICKTLIIIYVKFILSWLSCFTHAWNRNKRSVYSTWLFYQDPRFKYGCVMRMNLFQDSLSCSSNQMVTPNNLNEFSDEEMLEDSLKIVESEKRRNSDVFGGISSEVIKFVSFRWVFL